MIPKKKTIKSSLIYIFPIIEWLPHYSIDLFFEDLIAGISLASFQIPLSLSYATSLAHVPTVCGLYALIIPPIIYSIFGTVPQMIVGPEAAISLVVGQAVEPILKHEAINGVTGTELVVIIAAISGGSLLGAGLLGFGYLESVLNGALLSGFITAVGIVMIINGLIEELNLSELYKKLPGHEHSPLAKVNFLLGNFEKSHLPTLIISIITFLIIVGIKFLKKSININNKLKKSSSLIRWFGIFFPEILMTVILTTFISWLFKLDKTFNIEILGSINANGFKFENPVNEFEKYHFKIFFKTLLNCGYATAILGFFESTTAQKSLSSLNDMEISTDRELIALGMINLIGSIFGALPSFGGYGRSKINALSGAKTTFSGALMGIFTLFMTIYTLNLIYYLPKCLLSVISTIIGISLLEEAPSNILFHWKCKGYNELITFFITIIITLFSSLELGIAVGCIYSLLRVIKHSGKSRIFINVSKLNNELIEIMIIKIFEPLTFSNAEDMRSRMVKKSKESNKPISIIIIDITSMSSMDSSAAQILQQTIQRFVKRGVKCWIVGPSLSLRIINEKNDEVYIKRLKVLDNVEFGNSIEGVLDLIYLENEFSNINNNNEESDEFSLYSRAYMQFEVV